MVGRGKKKERLKRRGWPVARKVRWLPSARCSDALGNCCHQLKMSTTFFTVNSQSRRLGALKIPQYRHQINGEILSSIKFPTLLTSLKSTAPHRLVLHRLSSVKSSIELSTMRNTDKGLNPIKHVYELDESVNL
ncbi:hypothetical protein D8674_041141 [Pyrus ussuriensis x Pyrus communis]|uniref:Uncharacterized protein n=1 Tax=Pyrus ussuriensis x Pyrus communis TaxID=2448454 RepID=A0A5N5GWC6_9ROSA|nr:hypothetical protein D8674_041141 [Pyrus ussuriensis x Pyrus communis]